MLVSDTSLNYGEKPESGWDYVLVFRAPKLQKSQVLSYLSTASSTDDFDAGAARADILVRLRRAGFSYSQLWVPDVHKVLVRIALPLETLKNVAETINYPLELSEEYGSGYVPYHRDRSKCYVNYVYKHFFTPSERLQLTISAMERQSSWGAGINIDSYLANGTLIDAYPLHDRTLRRKLKNHIVYENLWDPFFKPNYRQLKDYWGSRISLYFAFLKFFTRMLIGIAIASVPYYFLLKYFGHGHFSFFFTFTFSLTLIFWCAYFQKYWKRRNQILNVQWGTFGQEYDQSFEVRPEFSGVPKKGFYSKGGFVDLSDLEKKANDEVTTVSDSTKENTVSSFSRTFGDLYERYRRDMDFQLNASQVGSVLRDLPTFLYSDKNEYRKRIAMSWAATIVFSISMISFTFIPTLFDDQIVAYFSSYSWADQTPGILIAALIFIGEQSWMQIYPTLARWENHRTKQAHLNSLIIKRFAFEFVINFSNIFYISFIKSIREPETCNINPRNGNADCYLELRNVVSTIILTKVTLDQVIELIVPSLLILGKRLFLWVFLRSNDKMRDGLLNTKTEITDEKNDLEDIKEEGLNTFETSIEDYAEVVIQYCFVALFGLVYPIAPLVFFLNNIVELRTDAFKYLYIFNRPPPSDSNTIGRWTSVLKFIGWVATWTNSALIVIHNPYKWSLTFSIVLFFLLQHFFSWVQRAIDMSLEDVPSIAYRMHARQNYLIARFFQIGDKPYYSFSIIDHTVDVIDNESVNLDLRSIRGEDGIGGDV